VVESQEGKAFLKLKFILYCDEKILLKLAPISFRSNIFGESLYMCANIGPAAAGPAAMATGYMKFRPDNAWGT